LRTYWVDWLLAIAICVCIAAAVDVFDHDAEKEPTIKLSMPIQSTEQKALDAANKVPPSEPLKALQVYVDMHKN
jgi:ferredoxin